MTKNFSEFDETDWEDEEEEFEDVSQFNMLNNNEQNHDKTKQTTMTEKTENVDKKRKQKRVRFKDVCGCEEVKADLMDLVDYLKYPSKYETLGCKLPKGILMSGAPGTGKTLLARALAGEAGVPFLATNGASFDEIYVGVGVARVRKLFERAKELAPCIVFIDEIDAIGNTRMQMGTAHSSDSLNALLTEMDGFERNSGIIVIAATNMPDRLDAALVRPGRFDRKVHISLPDKQARKQIINLYLKDRSASDVDVDMLVSDISGFSGAELESMVNLASIEAVKHGENKVSMKHLIEAKEMISMGRARRSLEVSPIVRKVTAYHESGHAVVSLFTRGSKPIYKATILPRGDALGFVASSNGDEFMATKESLLAELDVCMGGRAAEEIFNGNAHVTTGASSDFGHATRLAMAMVCQYGMSPKVGKIYYRIEDIPKLSPVLQDSINQEVKRLLDESYLRARSIIEDHKEEMHILASSLLAKETLTGEEIKQLIQWEENKIREPTDFIMINNDSLNLQHFQRNILKPETELLNTDITTDKM